MVVSFDETRLSGLYSEAGEIQKLGIGAAHRKMMRICAGQK
jgi:hypothetical protein